MTDYAMPRSSVTQDAEDVVLTVRFDPGAPPQCVDVEVAGEDDLTSDKILDIVQGAALRLTVFAADYRLAALLDHIDDREEREPMQKVPEPVRKESRCHSELPSEPTESSAAHLARGAKQDKGEYSRQSYQRKT